MMLVASSRPDYTVRLYRRARVEGAARSPKRLSGKRAAGSLLRRQDFGAVRGPARRCDPRRRSAFDSGGFRKSAGPPARGRPLARPGLATVKQSWKSVETSSRVARRSPGRRTPADRRGVAGRARGSV